MKYGYFSIKLIIQAVLLALTSVLFAFSLTRDDLVITKVNIILLWVVQVAFLIYYLHKPARKLAGILNSFDTGPKTGAHIEKNRFVFGINIDRELGRITDSISSLRAQKEKEYQLYHKCIENAMTGLLAVDEAGRVLAVNRAFSWILGTGRIESLEKLNEVKKGLGDWIGSVREEKRKTITLINNGKIIKLYLTVSVFRQDNRTIRIIAIQDIGPELAVQQAETMQKFVRLMSHEILNSVTPINLMTSGLISRQREAPGCPECGFISGPQRDDTLDVLDAIRKRSRGLVNFIESFRKTYTIPEPSLQKTDIADILRQVSFLFKDQLQNQNITLEINHDRRFESLMADRKLVEQVLINLVLNSIDAVKSVKNPVIRLNARIGKEGQEIEVSDNGCGMDTETMEKLSTPFFTTREGGTGSGLFFSRHVMRLHGGDLVIMSEKGRGTSVTLKF